MLPSRTCRRTDVHFEAPRESVEGRQESIGDKVNNWQICDVERSLAPPPAGKDSPLLQSYTRSSSGR